MLNEKVYSFIKRTNVRNKNKNIKENNIKNGSGKYSKLLENINNINNSSVTIVSKFNSVNMNILVLRKKIIDFTSDNSTKINGKKKEDKNKAIGEWWKQEKIAFISSLINRNIDKYCRVNKSKVSDAEKINIFNKIYETHLKDKNIEINYKCAQSSIVHYINSQAEIKKLIDSIYIPSISESKNNNVNTSHYFYLNIEEQLEENSISVLNADIHYMLAEKVYNSLLENSNNLDFDVIKKDIESLILKQKKNAL
ncbi:hypothetical protein M997_1982 [Proteus hauseri ATCC 700826]|uniref:Uncharacterized protein n=1 Tax=Proteus hauseri ATCC 700826 TaxID=1354271 RepID=A0AAJ3HRW7_PROHU|nr:hypothetical protein [Proteus hauseri]OAT46501.1 hypothetical protein M997_1982 [Proteus hauseri ATCC 700826]